VAKAKDYELLLTQSLAMVTGIEMDRNRLYRCGKYVVLAMIFRECEDSWRNN